MCSPPPAKWPDGMFCSSALVISGLVARLRAEGRRANGVSRRAASSPSNYIPQNPIMAICAMASPMPWRIL